MRKKIIEKKTKRTTNTYMREAYDYETVVIKNREDLFTTIKKYNKMTRPFAIKHDDDSTYTYLDNGYCLVELTPLNENYNIRFYIDRDKQIVSFYIDITLYNGEVDKVPYYVDLYLYIAPDHMKKTFKFLDEDELQEALDKKMISKKDYNLAYKTGNKLLEELKNDTNEYMKMDVVGMVNKYFK